MSAHGVPPIPLGASWQRLNAEIATALTSLPIVRGVEIICTEHRAQSQRAQGGTGILFAGAGKGQQVWARGRANDPGRDGDRTGGHDSGV